MKKKLLAFLISMIMMMSIVASAATNFTDISEKTHPWAYDAVIEMTQKGIINGVSQTSFAPDAKVTKIQALLLIARMLGFNDTVITDNINNIYSIYSDSISKINTSYKKELSFLAFLGIYTVDDFSNMKFDDPLTREEAAVFLAKANRVKQEDMDKGKVILNAFADDDTISEDCRDFVYYVRDKEYMNGVGNNLFSPKATVTRAQISTMLYRILKNVTTSMTKGTVDSVNASDKTVKIFVVTKTHELGDDVVYRNKGEVIKSSELYPNLYGIVTMNNGVITQFDTFFEPPVIKSETDGKITFISSEASATSNIQIKNLDTEDVVTYKWADRNSVIIKGAEATKAQLRVGDYVQLGLDAGNRIIKLEVCETSNSMSDLIVKKVTVTSTSTEITIVDKDDKEYTYPIPTGINIKKNGVAVDVSAINEGDKISTINFSYNRIKSIDAYSDITSNSGTISTIHLSTAQSYIVLTNGTSESTFNVNKDTKYYLYGESKAISDMQLGQYASVTLDGKTVSKVEVALSSQTSDVKGVVAAVNASAGFLTVTSTTNETVVVYISTKAMSPTKIIDNGSASAAQKTIKNIQVGASITAIGAITGGVFEATTVVFTNP